MNDKEILKKIEEDIEKNLYEINMNIDNLEYDLKSNILNCEEKKISKKIEELLEKNHELIKKIEKKENETKNLINYLKNEDADLKENVVIFEKKLRITSKESFYYNSYLKTLHRFRAKRELIKEILSKIERKMKNGNI